MTTLYGDDNEQGMLDVKAKGQNLVGNAGEDNFLYGDAYEIENSKGGNDVLTGGASIGNRFSNYLYGDAFEMSDSRGGNDVLTSGARSTNFLYGDAFQMTNSQGGNDVLTGAFGAATDYLYGDAYEMTDSRGGNDVLNGGTSGGDNDNLIYGDAYNMTNSRGGNDVLTGGNAPKDNFNTLFGDAFEMTGSRGGNDVLTGGTGLEGPSINNYNYNYLYGDAYEITDSRGGNDVLIGGARSAEAYLYGDAVTMKNSKGGNDELIGSSESYNLLYGDAKYHLSGTVVCGNDRLFSGNGNDEMWGDIAFSYSEGNSLDIIHVTTGHDVFVFSANNGTDTIHDFRHGEDKINLQGIDGANNFNALINSGNLSTNSTDTVITFGTNTITVIGVTDLSVSDFIFS